VETLESKIVAALQQERWKNGAALYSAHEKLPTQLRARAKQLERKVTARRRNGRSFHLVTTRCKKKLRACASSHAEPERQTARFTKTVVHPSAITSLCVVGSGGEKRRLSSRQSIWLVSASLPAVVTHDKASRLLLDRPGWREAAGEHSGEA
jgi:hypothetical protein